MLKIFQKQSALLKALKIVNRMHKERGNPFGINVYGQDGSVNLHIFDSKSLDKYGINDGSVFGFVILLFFNENKADKMPSYIRFVKNQYFNQFVKTFADGNIIYAFNCGKNIARVDKIANTILIDVFNAKEENKKVEYYIY